MSDEDIVELMPMAFPVDSRDVDIDLTAPPTTGEEYLRRVHREAKRCPQVVVADIDKSVFKEPTFKVNLSSGIMRAPCGFSPSSRWQEERAADFTFVRQNFARMKAKMKKEKMKPSVKIPMKDDVEGWCHLSFGRLHGRTTYSGSSAGGTPPLMSVVGFMDQPTVVQVLEYHINWFEVTGFTKEQGQWLFALLTCLEKPLAPEACSLIRTLSRNCANLRASLDNPEDPRLIPLNLIICLVARYFDQMDLADT